MAEPSRRTPLTHPDGCCTDAVEHTLRGVELLLLGMTRGWLPRTVLSGAAVLASGCSTRPAATTLDARPSPSPTPPTDASPAAAAAQERTRAEAHAAEQTLAQQGTQNRAPLDVTTPAPGGGKPLPCREDQPLFPVRASGLSIETAPEYLELRSLQLASEGRGAVEQFTIVERLGKPCASATGMQCSRTLAGPISEASASICVQLCTGYSVVTTQGDQVKQWSGPAELRQLLGDIVSEHDALLLVASSGYQLECDNPARSAIRKLEDGFEVYATRITGTCAPVESTRYRLHVSTRGELRELDKLVVSRAWDVCIGRVPTGLTPARRHAGGSALGDFLAHCAHLEEASVYAFERMASELAAHGAPAALVERAHEAARDERRHARRVRELAQARGGHVQRAEVAAAGTRCLEQVARENVVEGCVRETYGALLAAHQAAHARDRQLRDAMLDIARDELRHAALSHAVHAWLCSQLDSEAGARLTEARHEAIHALQVQCETAHELPWHADAGLPNRTRAGEMLAELRSRLWTGVEA